mmetsp:Transcript_63398/g.151695  ORF Transcript_63398/g.151695 Transcript_63398/m.151695 type:complete len:433 (+) Transcript_63398:49-1347(+)
MVRAPAMRRSALYAIAACASVALLFIATQGHLQAGRRAALLQTSGVNVMFNRPNEKSAEVTDGAYDDVESNEEISVSLKGAKASTANKRAVDATAAVPADDFQSGDVAFSWDEAAAAARRDERALAERPASTQKLSSGFLESQGVNTGEPFVGDEPVPEGAQNPRNIIAAGRAKPDLMPNPPATGSPKKENGKLDTLGVNTGNKRVQWDDDVNDPTGLEDPYSVGPSPNRERSSPSHRAGGVFKQLPSLTLLEEESAEAAAHEEETVAHEEDADAANEANVVYDNWGMTPEDRAAAKGALAHAPTSSGRMVQEGVNTGEVYWRLGDELVKPGSKNPAHLIQAEHPAPVYNPVVKTAHPPSPFGHLDSLGLNTGEAHSQSGDTMVDAEGLEGSYNLGGSPVRELTSPVGRLGYAAGWKRQGDAPPPPGGGARP